MEPSAHAVGPTGHFQILYGAISDTLTFMDWLEIGSEGADEIAELAGMEPALYAALLPWYAKLARWAHGRSGHHAGLWVLGVQGVQGVGKSSLAVILGELLRRGGIASVATLSIDDLYLTREEREALSKDVHPLLKTRGVPGTHDVSLGLATIAALRAGSEVRLPQFDKTIDDRAPTSTWPRVGPELKVLIFEGWFVGCDAAPEESLAQPINDLERDEDPHGDWRRHVHAQLRDRYPALWQQLDALCVLQAPDAEYGFTWRWRAEQRTREALEAAGKDSSRLMNRAQVRRFVDLYTRIARHALGSLPDRADAVLQLDAQHRVHHARFKDDER